MKGQALFLWKNKNSFFCMWSASVVIDALRVNNRMCMCTVCCRLAIWLADGPHQDEAHIERAECSMLSSGCVVSDSSLKLLLCSFVTNY